MDFRYKDTTLFIYEPNFSVYLTSFKIKYSLEVKINVFLF